MLVVVCIVKRIGLVCIMVFMYLFVNVFLIFILFMFNLGLVVVCFLVCSVLL